MHEPVLQTAPATHWAAVVQVVLQLVVPLQVKLPQAVVVDAAQSPAPLQLAALVVVPFVQDAARQFVAVPGNAQVPAELHEPAHAPLPAQAVRQQTPLAAQKPLAHWVAAVHVCPGFSLQAPVASQLLVPEQLLGSSAPLMAAQVPPVPHAWQAPHVAVPQHTPSTQFPLVHSEPAAHAVPPAFLATQEFVDEQ